MHKKIIAPVIITAITVIYYVAYFLFFVVLFDNCWKYALAIIPLLISAIMIKVCMERINEIKEGEENDIGKY